MRAVSRIREARIARTGTKPRTKARTQPRVAAKVGRPSSYRPEFAAQVRTLCRLGATDADLAEAFDVTVNTIDNWKKAHPEFLGALKDAKATADQVVVQSLFKRATGYEHDAVKINLYEGDAVITPYTERYPPDTTACIFWLKNRQPEQWRDKTETEHSGKIGLEELVAGSWAPNAAADA